MDNQSESPIEVAKHLANTLEKNTIALIRVQDSNKILKKFVRGLVVICVVLFILMLLQVSAYFALQDETQNRCEANNDVRHGLLNIADTIEQAPVQPGKEEATASFVAGLRRDFVLIDC